MRQKYDSSVVFLYATGNEALLPKEFRQQIPYTTISSWRKADYSSYIGNEFRYFFDEAFEVAELKFNYRKQKRALIAFARSWLTLSVFLKPVLKKVGKDKTLRKKLLDAIEYMKEHLGTEKTIKLLGITKSQYRQWILEEQFSCFDSSTSLCVKRYPHQLATKEIKKIKKMLLDPELAHWPILSIAAFSLREGKIIASLYSWYKYAKLYGVTRQFTRKDQKKIGLIATYPNEYLHADLTELIVGGKKAYMSVVMDNYSKMILGFHIGRRRTAHLGLEALRKAVEVILKHPNHSHSFLVTDGGTENHNKFMEEFIRDSKVHKLTKIRALKDIQFSNSPVEAIHKIMKGRYLPKRIFDTMQSLQEYLDWAVHDYNELRPHYRHSPRTPYEAYFDIPLKFDLKKRRRNAVKKRVKKNSCSKCIQCKLGPKLKDCCSM